MDNERVDPQPIEEKDWLTTAEVASLLGVSTWTVTRWAKSGKLPAMTLPSGHRRFARTEIEKMLATAS